MTSIVIDLSALADKELSIAAAGIKLFMHRKKDLALVLIGDTNGLLTLSGVENIRIIDPNRSEDAKPTKKSGLLLACSLIDNPDDNTLVTFGTKYEVSQAIEATREQIISSPIFVASYPNAYTGKKTLLGDLGYKPSPTEADYLDYLKQMVLYVQKTEDIKDPSAKLLLPSGLIKTAGMKKLAAHLKSDPSYQGEIGTADMLEADCDILIGDPSIIQATISGVDQGVTVFNEYLNNGMSHSFQFKFGGIFIRKLLDNFSASIDKKLTSGGTALLGFDKNVVLVRKDTTANGVSACLDLAYKLAKV